LILEEALETINALGFQVMCRVPYPQPTEISVTMESVEMKPTLEPNLIEIADGCADISVVTIGTLSACGIADGPLLEEVDNSNLQKFGPGSHRREDGKWMKPSGWVPPKIEQVLEDQRHG
jgi:predicted HAD superfamily Cof-like phosphohydrolase